MTNKLDKLDIEISKALNVLNSINEEYRLSQICKINDSQKATYKKLLEDFERLNKIPPDTPNAPKNLHNLKGAALEELVQYLLLISGGIFEVDYNLHTTTNEIDDLVTLTPKGKTLLGHNLINPRLDTFLGE